MERDEGSPVLHRIDEVCERLKISRKVLAGRLGITKRELDEQLDRRRDLRLSQLITYADALCLPVGDLLVDERSETTPRLNLDTLRTIFKIASGIADSANDIGTKRMANQLIEQLDELAIQAKVPTEKLQHPKAEGILKLSGEDIDTE